jgi:hypothetical protein
MSYLLPPFYTMRMWCITGPDQVVIMNGGSLKARCDFAWSHFARECSEWYETCFRAKEEKDMTDLIASLEIFRRYADNDCPTRCVQNVMFVHGVFDVSAEDARALHELGWESDDDPNHGVWRSYRFGSA